MGLTSRGADIKLYLRKKPGRYLFAEVVQKAENERHEDETVDTAGKGTDFGHNHGCDSTVEMRMGEAPVQHVERDWNDS